MLLAGGRKLTQLAAAGSRGLCLRREERSVFHRMSEISDAGRPHGFGHLADWTRWGLCGSTAAATSGDGFGLERGLDRIDDLLAGILQAVAPHQASASHPDTVVIRRQPNR